MSNLSKVYTYSTAESLVHISNSSCSDDLTLLTQCGKQEGVTTVMFTVTVLIAVSFSAVLGEQVVTERVTLHPQTTQMCIPARRKLRRFLFHLLAKKILVTIAKNLRNSYIVYVW
jgi:hypothetical protein